ncbi:hypothetical protein AURDEDRAFT_173218 [Auricularia subglabra TFB-10046 SS5]|uniref:F-box domain-containing protein n=1 Tax=Auricularia subglabra (strain TFB-10046 / SS5) TaxID=717982 RepID=J0WUT3_AURST|nr:hypothetical protein AURDEDRAFT_173218 [Auricularia subglabra TFB-10046 SS5]
MSLRHAQDMHSHVQQLAHSLLHELQLTRGAALSTDDVEAMLRSLTQGANAAIIDVARQYNATTSSVNHIPVEVVCNILSWLTFDQRIVASHVCHHWRAIAVDSPRLWNRLDFRRRNLELAGVLLSRSKDTPLVLRVRNVAALPRLDCLRNHISHTQFLDLDTAACDQEDLLASLSTSAPMLRSLRFFRCSSSFRLPDRLFDLNAPLLHDIAMHHDVLPVGPTPALSAVRVLVCESISSPETLAARLGQLPSIDSLVFSFGDTFSVSQLTTKLRFPSFRRLEITECPSDANVQTMLPLLSHQDVSCIVLTAPRTQTTLDVILQPLARIEFMALRIRRRGLTADFALYGNGRKRAFLCVAHDLAMRYLTNASFAHLVTLIIHEGFWPTQAALPLAPALLHLTVALTSSAQHITAHRLRRPLSPGIFFLERGRAFVTPLLQTVCLTCRLETKSQPLVVSASDVADFVTSALLTPIARPPRLVLRNVTLLEPAGSSEIRSLGHRVSSIAIDTRTHDEDELPSLLRPATNVIFGDNTY